MSDNASEDGPGGLRSFSGAAGQALTLVCALIALFHLYVAIDPVVSELTRNALHYGMFGFLAAVLYPALGPGWRENRALALLDTIFGLAVAASAVWLLNAESAIYDRGVNLAPMDWLAIAVAILGAVELTRRLTGFIIPALILLSLTYVGWWGQYVGGVFSFPGLSWETVAFRSVYGDDAMFGSIARISSTTSFSSSSSGRSCCGPARGISSSTWPARWRAS